jgi:serine/threonine protein kinase
MNGQNFGKYQLLKKLATGGMAEVWLARHSGIEGFSRLLVVKRILPHLADDPEFVQMFLNEAKIAARFNHPNIAQIYDLGETNGTYFIAMEFVHGEDLGRLMRKAWSTGQWIARPLAIRIVASACEGLYYAHTKADDRGNPLRVVHRDISPQNILVSFDGSVKLVDFGIAKAADAQSMTRSGAIKGKFAYMAPEQASGKTLDHRSDIFAIGLVLYELLTGVRPLKRDSELGTLQAALECAIEPPSQVADVPAELDSVVMSALAKAADDRYRDARTFQMALEEFLVSQRWVATSVQISELMTALFQDRLDEEARLGYPDPVPDEGSSTAGTPLLEVASGSSGGGAGTQPGNPAADMSWEAPPATTAEDPLRAQRAANRSRTSSEQRRSTAAPDVAGWEAPPAAEIPGQRRMTGETRTAEPTGVRRGTGMQPARGSRVDAPRATADAPLPPRRPSTRNNVVQEDGPPPRRTRSSSATPGADGRPSSPGVRRRTGESLRQEPAFDPVEDDEASGGFSDEEDEGSRPGAGGRRRKSGQFSLDAPRRVSQAGAMPEAPVRERKEDDEPERKKHRARRPDAEDELDRAVDPQARGRRVKGVVVAVALVFLSAAGWLYREQIMEVLESKPGDDIYVSVDSNLQLDVYVEHAADEGRKELTYLGRSPIKRRSGAHVRDTLVFENKARGVKHRYELTYGQPGDHRQIRHDVSTGHYTLRFEPQGLQNLSLFLNGEQIGTYPGPKLELVEGRHALEVRGLQLKQPAQIDIEVKGNQNTTSKVFNLSSLMN